MENRPKVSVIIPVYGVEKYFKEALDSVINQSLKDIEIILLDDGSKDSCPQIIDEYACKDSRIIPVHKENGGYGHTCNLGLELARGEYIAILEPDDYIDSNMYQDLYNIAKEYDSDIVKSSYYDNLQSKELTRIKKVVWKDKIPEDRSFTIKEYPFFLSYHPSIWSAIYKAEFLKKNNIKFIEAKGAGWTDNPFQVQTMCLADRINYTSSAYYFWRRLNYFESDDLKDYTIPFLRSDEVHKWLREKGIKDEKILSKLYTREILYYRTVLGKTNLENKDEVYKKVKTACSLMNRDIILNGSLCSKAIKSLFLKCEKRPELVHFELFLKRYIKKIRHKKIPTAFLEKILEKIYNVERICSCSNVYSIFNIKIKLKPKAICKQENIFTFKEGDFEFKGSLCDLFLRLNNDEFLKVFQKYFAQKDISSFDEFDILSYLTVLIEKGNFSKAKEIFEKYNKSKKFKHIHRFLPVASFARKNGYADSKIEKAVFVYETLEKNRANRLFEKLVEGKTVALVGNAPSETGKNKGSEIDSHDIVIRINNYATEGFEKDYGSKTDIWIRGAGGNDVKDRTKQETYLACVWAVSYSSFFVHFDNLDILLRDLSQNKIVIDIPKISMEKLRSESKIQFPTTGLTFLYYLLNSCNAKKVDLYGFSFLQEKQDNYATHYFNDRSEKEAKERSIFHFFDKESEYIKQALVEKIKQMDTTRK